MTFGKGCGSAVKDTWYPSTCPPFSPLSLLSCSTEELLFDPHWTVLQFFSLSLIFSPPLSSIATVFLWQATLPFDPPASKTKTRSCGRKGEKMKGAQWSRGEEWGATVERVMGGVSVEAVRPDPCCSVCQSPIKNRELWPRTVDQWAVPVTDCLSDCLLLIGQTLWQWSHKMTNCKGEKCSWYAYNLFFSRAFFKRTV